jgi:hypothetical protein
VLTFQHGRSSANNTPFLPTGLYRPRYSYHVPSDSFADLVPQVVLYSVGARHGRVPSFL